MTARPRFCCFACNFADCNWEVGSTALQAEAQKWRDKHGVGSPQEDHYFHVTTRPTQHGRIISMDAKVLLGPGQSIPTEASSAPDVKVPKVNITTTAPSEAHSLSCIRVQS
jgi:hypothetical protein